MAEFICAGYGGQGILVTGMIIAYAGMEQGNNVTWFPSYGAEMRGGSANCHVKVQPSEIASPYVSSADVLIALNDVSIDRLENKIKPGGWLLYNGSLVEAGRRFREDINIAYVNATDISQSLGNTKGTNLVMLGALTKITDLFDIDYFKLKVKSFFEEKGKFNPKNDPCLDEGALQVKIVRTV